jgi:hypothetical protein
MSIAFLMAAMKGDTVIVEKKKYKVTSRTIDADAPSAFITVTAAK